ncbi:SGNH/GDSL hydrolase family protein [uncultured Arthrobacter sp.]|uniref:SGNH/GDSL hydrolase family protein n=1 Tax=uncultured Arthrobacter sp. TaxID=114050 RepID=UPI003216DCB1
MDFLKRRNRNRTSFPFRYAKELGFGLLALAAIVIVVLALTQRDKAASAPPVPSVSAPQASRGTVPNIDIIGDSYVAGSDQGGYGAANWTKIVGSRFYAEARPVDMNVIAHAGAGYIVRGPEKVTFTEAATTSLRSTADLVVVFGSRNDGRQDPANMKAAATELFSEIRDRAPQAKLIVVGPAWVDDKVPDFIVADSQALAGAAAAAGVPFVNPLSEGWFFGADAKYIGADGVQPTDAGHEYLAGKMYKLISANLAAMAAP